MAFPKFNFEKILTWIARMSKREKILFYGASLVVLLVVSDRIVIRPIFSAFRAMNEQARDLKIQIKRSLKILAEKDQIETEIKRYAEYMVKPKSAEEETIGLLKYVEGLANEAGVNLLYVKPAGEKSEGREKKFYVTLECEAQMAQLLTFFYKVESSKLILKVERFSIQPVSQESSVIKSGVTIAKTVAL